MFSGGKFIVIYGANNLGKSTQVELLRKNLARRGIEAAKIKYPIYDLEPTGPIINSALRGPLKDKLSDIELQKLFAQNRRDYQYELERLLKTGTWVIAEDYKGTGIAWGVASGIPLVEMEAINHSLLKEDLAILLDGERFASGIERGHRHEEDRDWNLARQVHLELGERYAWVAADANQSENKVASDIIDIVESGLPLYG